MCFVFVHRQHVRWNTNHAEYRSPGSAGPNIHCRKATGASHNPGISSMETSVRCSVNAEELKNVGTKGRFGFYRMNMLSKIVF